jgi:hypothetical protein
MSDISIDATILEICERLYRWNSDYKISLVCERNDDDRYVCSVIMSSGPFICDIISCNMIDDWRIKLVLWSEFGYNMSEAKRQLLNSLLEKCKFALEVPIEKVMSE